MEVLFRQALFLPLFPKNAPFSLRPNTFLSSLQLHFQRKSLLTDQRTLFPRLEILEEETQV